VAYKLLGAAVTAADSAGAADTISDAAFVYATATAASTITITEPDSDETVVGSIRLGPDQSVVLKKDHDQEVYASATTVYLTPVAIVGE